MMGITRLLLVGALAVVGFVVATFAFKQVPFSECQADANRDSSYKLAIEPNPNVDIVNYQLRVTEDGDPVEDAEVCLRADMGGPGNMSGMGTSAVARDSGPGVYDITIRFEMGGHWNVVALVRPPGGDTIEVPFAVQAE
jgi:hypothetical protein